MTFINQSETNQTHCDEDILKEKWYNREGRFLAWGGTQGELKNTAAIG